MTSAPRRRLAVVAAVVAALVVAVVATGWYAWFGPGPRQSDMTVTVGRGETLGGGGPAVVAVRKDGVFDVSARFSTVSALCEEANPAEALRGVAGERIGDLESIVANTPPDRRDTAKPWLPPIWWASASFMG